MGLRKKVYSYRYPTFVFVGLLSTLGLYQNFIPTVTAPPVITIPMGDTAALQQRDTGVLKDSVQVIYSVRGEAIPGAFVQKVHIDPETGQIASVDVMDPEDPSVLRTLESKEIAEVVY